MNSYQSKFSWLSQSYTYFNLENITTFIFQILHMANNNVQQFLFEQIFSLLYFLKKNHCDGLKKVIDVPQWDPLLLSLNVLMNTKLVSWHRKARKSACWSQITLNLTTTNSSSASYVALSFRVLDLLESFHYRLRFFH